MATFDQLAIPFPLFEAPVTGASGYAGTATCRVCGGRDRHCFKVDHLIVPCPACGVGNGLGATGRADADCRSCGSVVPFPDHLKAKRQILVCHGCLRAGRGAISKGTEFGAVTWEQALDGVTLGVPGLWTDEFELVPIDPGEGWYGVRVPSEHLRELLRTPNFPNWQEERWLFCCRCPMTYIGGWDGTVEASLPGDERAFFEGLIDPSEEESREWVWEGVNSGRVCLYVYRCKTCHRRRATWDTD